MRQVVLPDVVSRSLLSLPGNASAYDPVFAGRKGVSTHRQGAMGREPFCKLNLGRRSEQKIILGD